MTRKSLLALFALLLVPWSHAEGAVPSGRTSNPGPGYTLILVEADTSQELAEARNLVTEMGGTISITVGPHALLGWVPREVDSRILGKAGIRSIHRSVVDLRGIGFSDRSTQLAVSSFNDVVSGRKARRDSRRNAGSNSNSQGFADCSFPRPAINREEFARNLRSLGKGRPAETNAIEPNFFSTSDVMDGTVAVAVFLVESNGGVDPNLYSWSQADQDFAITQIIEGLNWWVEQSRAFNLARPLQFTLVPFLANHPAVHQPYEPVLHAGHDASLWVDRIMANVGASSGDTFARVAAFNHQLRNDNHTNWAYSMFVAYNPPPAPTAFADGRASWAYIGGPHTNILFRSFGWQLSRIASHESGHVFFACDEYAQSGSTTCSCTCAPQIRPTALNGNCQESSCGSNSTQCMMRLNELALCPFTVAQIGWTSAVPTPAPSAPVSLVAAALSPSQVGMLWQDTSTVEHGFQIERRGGSSAEYSQIGVVGANSTSYTDPSALPNTAYAYRVRSFNNTGTSSYSNEAVVVTPASASGLTIGTGELPDAVVNVSYSRTLVATGGRPAYSWSLESGFLPAGVSLSQSGTISGTPGAAGSNNFVVRVTDADGTSATKPLRLVVASTALLAIATTQLPKGSVGTIYSQTLVATGGQSPYSWQLQSGNLPEGISLNQAGSLAGTPERAGTSSFVLKVIDAANATSSVTLSIVVNPAGLFLNLETVDLPDGVLGQNYSQLLKATGGSAPYRWELAEGSLPEGLSISEVGLISGKPLSEGEAEFTVRVVDQTGESASREFSIDIEPPAELTILNPSVLPAAAITVPYRVELKATAGIAPYKWIKKKKKKKFGVLPDGIALSSTGILSGTPTAEGTFNFTVRVYDAGDKLASQPFSIQVGPPPAPLLVATEIMPQAIQGLPYNAQLAAAGGLGPYSWSIDSGVLPAGLTMSVQGLITGRPTTVGSTSFTVRVKDSLGTASTRTLFIVVGPPPPPLVILTVSLPDTTAEVFYSQSLSAAGGVPPYTWTLASGSLGTGLNLSAGGTISGVPTSPGTSVFVVRVTDSAQQSINRTLAISIKPADKLAPFGILETPDHRSTVIGLATGSGWALDNVGVTTVEVLLDNAKVGEAVYGLNRPDVAALWNTFPNSQHSGFSFTLDTTRFTNGEHQLAVRVLDAAGNSTLIGLRAITIQNQVVAIFTSALPRGTKGQPFSAQFEAVNGRLPYSWTLVSGSLPSGLSLDIAGRISGVPTVFGLFTFTVRVTDAIGSTASASYTLEILPDFVPLRIISTGSLTDGSTGVAYAHQIIWAGGFPPRTWSMASGALPPGLSLGASNGLISGTPTEVGTYEFIVRLADSTQASVTSNPLFITVLPGPLLILTEGDLPDATLEDNYSFVLEGAGGDPPYSWTLAEGELPPGLSLNSSTGAITGTPTEHGEFTFTVTLTDTQPLNVTSGTLRITVNIAPLVITSTGNLPGGRLNISYSNQLAFTGGIAPYTWEVATGTLPPGLTLDPSTGVISGTPTATGQFNFTVRLTDGQPVTAVSGNLRIVITP